MAEQTAGNVPQIRFKGFEGEWDQRMLGDEPGEIVAGGDVEKHKLSVRGKYPVLANALQNHGILGFYENDFRVKAPAVTVTGRGDVGHAEVREISFTPVVRLLSVKSSHNVYFLKESINTHKVLVESTGVPQLTVPQLSKYRIYFPGTIGEENKIGGYFRELDSLIGLHQRKHDKLVTLKKAMLQKMFPQAGATTPEIRFKGFEGDWVERKLGESAVNISNNSLSRANLNSRSGLAKNIHYGDILVKYGEVLDIHNDGVPFISDDALANKLRNSRLQDGDIVMADAAEDEMVGKCTEIQNVRDQLVLAGLHTIALRPIDSFAPFYLGYFLNADAFHNQLLRLMQGTKVLSVSKTLIKETIIYFPTDSAEQKKIGTYFRTLDELITKHATQLQKLQQIKSACLERMFV